MKTKLFILISLFLMAVSGTNAQIILDDFPSIEDQLPIDFTAYYSYSQQIIPRYQINASTAGNITALKFHLNMYYTISNSNSWTVYVGHTSKSSFTNNTDWIPASQMTKVFDGTVTQTNGAITINFTTPFAYNNTDNLVIAVNEHKSGRDNSKFFCYKVLPDNTMIAKSFSGAINPSNPPQATTMTDLRSFITIVGLTSNTYPACPSVITLTDDEQLTQPNPTFTWRKVKGATGYKISVGTTSGGTDVLNMQDLGNVTSYQLTAPLAYATKYYYTIYAYNASGISAGCVERTFRTIEQPPVNDECANAVSLTVNPNLNYTAFTSGTTLKATDSQVPKPTACSGEPDDDVWYSFVATSTRHTIKLNNIVSSSENDRNINLEGFSGNCGSLTSIGCTQYAYNEALTLTDLTVGNTYYVRVYSYSKDTKQYSYRHSFDISVGTLPPPPANDNCENAIALTINPDMNCTSFASGNTLGATPSPQANNCSGTADDDIWYKFTATQSTHYIKFFNQVSTGTGFNPYLYMQVYNGNCNELTPKFCSSANDRALTGLTVGDTYYVRLYTYGGAGHYLSFDVCVGNFPTNPPPANDECSNAQTLTVNTDINCTSKTSGNTLGATDSGIPVCSGSYAVPDDDVWYKFTALSDKQIFTLSNIQKTGVFNHFGSYLNVEIFNGTCGSLTSIYCTAQPDLDQDFSFSVPGLATGTTYYVRVFDDAGIGYNMSFDICVATLSNDECSGALPLSIFNGLTPVQISTDTFIDTRFATKSNVPLGTCNGDPDDDLWYKFTATSNSHYFNITGINDTGTYTGSHYVNFQLFKGVCGSLVSIACGSMSTLVSGLTIGETYYLRVYSYNSGSAYRNSFYLSVQTPPAPPTNSLCDGAYEAYPLPYTYTQNDANGDIALPIIYTCRMSADGLWYKFTGDSTRTIIKVIGNESDDFFNEPNIGVYTGSCGNFTCAGYAYANDNEPTASLSLSTTQGTVYYVNVTNNKQIESKFTINIISDKTTGISSTEKEMLHITPNPANDYFTLSCLETETVVLVYDITGKKIIKKIVTPDEKINVSTLSKGLYLVKVNNETAKLIVK